MSYKVKLPVFEGPFDLLVYLIENAQMSIYDIQVSEITSQYLDYIGEMQRSNVNVSSEFMVLAAELIQIKSRMMLPQPVADGEFGEVEDPRSALAARLVEYKKCKAAAEMLQEREERMSGVWEKPQEDISVYLENPDEYLRLGIDEFAESFRQFLYRKQKIDETRRHYSMVERERETMENRMRHICRVFAAAGGSEELRRHGIDFREFIPNQKDRYDIVVSFVSLLQLMREKFLDATQEKLYGNIMVTAGSRDIAEAEEGIRNDE